MVSTTQSIEMPRARTLTIRNRRGVADSSQVAKPIPDRDRAIVRAAIAVAHRGGWSRPALRPPATRFHDRYRAFSAAGSPRSAHRRKVGAAWFIV